MPAHFILDTHNIIKSLITYVKPQLLIPTCSFLNDITEKIQPFNWRFTRRRKGQQD